MRARAFYALLLCVFAGCELNEVTVTESEDVVVAELILRTDTRQQRILLHRTIKSDSSSTAVPGAVIKVTSFTGEVMPFIPTSERTCVSGSDADSTDLLIGSCYIADTRVRFDVKPGVLYTLRIELPGGGVMTGSTRVPADFRMIRPAGPVCSLAPHDTVPLVWTRSSDAWVYAAETSLRNLKVLLAPLSIGDPQRLFGLSASAEDTTITFPTEFGLFQRFDENLTAALIAISHGLPAGAFGDVVIAAADRNYVNWERGGNFNPSGTIRIPSIRGAGTGVFGSIVPRTFQIRVGTGSADPPC